MPDAENIEVPAFEGQDNETDGVVVKIDSNKKEIQSEHRADTNESNTPSKNIIRQYQWIAILLIFLLAIATLHWFNRILPQNISYQTKQTDTHKVDAIQQTAETKEAINFINLTLADTEQVWKKIFLEKHSIYKKPKQTLFSGITPPVCGLTQSSSGSFYCPQEQQIYIDLSQYPELNNRLDIPGDFAQAYIVSHEVGHHIQNLAGISEQIPEARLQLNDKAFKRVSLRLELQADCFAGIWAKNTNRVLSALKQQDIVDAFNAVNRISREYQKAQTEDIIIPDPLTHGSVRQRTHWFMTGYSKGSFDACDTFTTADL